MSEVFNNHRESLVQQFKLEPAGISYVTEYNKAELNSKKGTWKVGNETRVLVLYKWKIYAWNVGAKKWSHEFHLLDLQSVIAPDTTKIALVMKGKGNSLEMSHINTNEIIDAVDEAYMTYFSDIPDAERVVFEVEEDSEPMSIPPPPKPCGGFDQQYLACCDYIGADPYMRIVDDVYRLHSNGVTEFNIHEFLGANDLTLFSALRMNSYFRSITLSNQKFKSDVMAALNQAISSNVFLEHVHLKDIEADKSSWQSFTANLAQNSDNLTILSLTIENCGLDDKSFNNLANFVTNMPHGLQLLNLSKNDCKKSGAIALFQGMAYNPHHLMTLQTLDISDMPLDNASSHLSQWLASGNCVQTLKMANTSPKWEPICESMKIGCPELEEWDISQNKVSNKDVGYLADGLQNVSSLSKLVANNMNIGVDQFHAIFTAVAENENLDDVDVVAQSNGLGMAGGLKVSEVLADADTIVGIDLSDNVICDEGIFYIAEAATNHPSLQSLVLNGCWKEAGKKANKGRALEALVTMIASSTPLETLHLAGGNDKKNQWPTTLCNFITELSSNDTITDIDVSNNGLSDIGATALGQMLQLNRSIKSLKWDNNMTTELGLANFLNGLSHNASLINMPLPLQDASKIMTETTIDTINKISNCIVANNQHAFVGLQNDRTTVRHLRAADQREVAMFRARIAEPEIVQVPLFKDALKQDTVIEAVEKFKEYEHDMIARVVSDKIGSIVNDMFAVVNETNESIVDTLVAVLTDEESGFSDAQGLMDPYARQELQEILQDSFRELDKDDLLEMVESNVSEQVLTLSGKTMDRMTGIAVGFLDDVLLGKLNDMNESLMASSSSSSSSSDKDAKDKRRYSSRGVSKPSMSGKKKKEKKQKKDKKKKDKKGKGKAKKEPEPEVKVEEVKIESKPLETIRKPVKRGGRRAPTRKPGTASPANQAASAIAKPIEQVIEEEEARSGSSSSSSAIRIKKPMGGVAMF